MSINQWGSNGNTGFAIPMESATPALPNSQAYTLAWNPTTQLLSWVPVSIDAVSGSITPAGDLNLAINKVVNVGSNQVVAARNTGWTADTGTPLKTAFDTATVTLPQLAGQVMALKSALITHGLIGA